MFDANHFSGEFFQMPLTVTSVTSPNGCSHKTVTVDLDGETLVVETDDVSSTTLCAGDYKETLVRAAICRMRAKGFTLTQMAGKGLF